MRNKDNLITKFRKLWKSLSALERERLWDIMSALRGQDSGLNDDVKFAVTARIRGELLGCRYTRGYTFPTLAEAKKEILLRKAYDLRTLKKNYKNKPSHFKAHIRSAIEALNFLRPKTSMRDLQKFLEY